MQDELASKSLTAIRNLIHAGRPLIYIQSPEENRTIGLLTRLADEHPAGKLELFVWSATEGLQAEGKPYKTQPSGARGILDNARYWPGADDLWGLGECHACGETLAIEPVAYLLEPGDKHPTELVA